MKSVSKKPLYISEKRDKFIFCIIVTFIIGLTAHAYQFFHSSFSHDSLNAIYANMTEIKWKISLGRFVVPLIMQIRGHVALPWLVGLMALFLIAMSLYLILETMQIDSKPVIILISIFMVTNRTVYAMVATYIYEFDYDMLALFFASFTAYILITKDKICWYIVAVLSCVLSLGLYQSYIEVAFAIVIIASLKNTLEGSKSYEVLKRGIKAIISFVLSIVIYYFIYKFSCKMLNVKMESRTDILSEERTSILIGFKPMIKMLGYNVLHPGTIYNFPILGVIDSLLVAVGGILCLIMVIRLGRQKVGEIIISLLLLVALPISLNLIYLVSNGLVHDLMTYQFNFLYIFSIVMIYMFNRERGVKVLNVIAIALCAIIGFNNIIVSNTIYLKKDMEKTASVSLITRVIDDLEERDDYSVGKTPIFFVGVPEELNIREGFDILPELPIGSEYSSSFYKGASSDVYNPYEKFFIYYLNYPVNYSDKDFSENVEVENMPTYPEKGYIQNIDGVLVVKMG